MFGAISRFFARIVVLVPGIVITVFAVKELFPSIDRRLPLALAIIVTYVLVAYILIPVAFRLIRIVIRPRHIPLYCTTPDGFASDPVNIGVVGTRKQLVRAMSAAGWHKADRRTLKSLVRMGVSIVRRRPYLSAPFSSLYLFGRSQDIGFQLPVDDNPLHRHHVRFWASTYTHDPSYRSHVRFWQRHHKTKNPTKILWVGAASLDAGFAPIRHNAQITHMIHPDTNAERELLATQLKNTKLIKNIRTVAVGKPYQLRNRALRGYLQTDGKMIICEL